MEEERLGMLAKLFEILHFLDQIYWGYIGCFALIAVGTYLTFSSRFYQFRVIRHAPTTIKQLLEVSHSPTPGISPLRLFFATAGGMIGLGNVIAVVTAVVIGGPGALFWLWMSAIVGIIIKYSETYLGLKYRQMKPDGNGYVGGPMYFIPHAFNGLSGKILARVVAFLLCIYGVEIYQFTVVSETLHRISGIDQDWMIVFLLIFTVYVGLGGVQRLSNVCSTLMPLFITLYTGMCLWIIFKNITVLPHIIKLVFTSAFTGHSALGGFAGATFWMALQYGASKSVYSADIAIGFDSLIQSESRAMDPQHQGRVVMVAMLLDTFICSMTILILLVSGVWNSEGAVDNAHYLISALKLYFPAHVEYLFAFTIFLVGVTSIQAYFVAGLKSALYLSPKWGRIIYFSYAIFAFWTFAHYQSAEVMLVMSLCGGALILINLISIFRLRKQVNFKHSKNES